MWNSRVTVPYIACLVGGRLDQIESLCTARLHDAGVSVRLLTLNMRGPVQGYVANRDYSPPISVSR